MYEFFLIVILVLVIFYAVYLNFAKCSLWEDLQVEKVRREWDLAFFYYESHPKDFEILTKEHFLEDFPVLKQVFAKLTIDEIKDYLKYGSADILPYYENVDKFIDRVLYNGKPSIFRRFRKR